MSRRNCDKCGEHRWSFDGYCLSVECAGSVFNPDWPQSKPINNTGDMFVEKRVRKPRGKSLAEALKYYKHVGKKPPWEE